jgi:hypothetical protein
MHIINMIKRRSFFLIIIPLFIISSCKKDLSVGPEESKPGRRDYKWTADTLYHTPINEICGIWGSSENNVWCIAHAGEMSKTLWHYDGSKWVNIHITRFEPTSIFGFNSNEIWTGTNNQEFWKFDGSSWIKISEHTIGDDYCFVITKIFGDSPNNIYGIGTALPYKGSNNKPILMHFNGSKWDFVNTPNITANFQDIVKNPQSKNEYLIEAITVNTENGDSVKLFTFDGNHFNQIYAGLGDYNGCCNITVMQGFAYIEIGKKIYRYQNNNLVLVADLSNTNYIARIWGRSEKDFFCITNDGIGHYNGTDLTTIYKGYEPRNAFVFENEVFFYTYDYNIYNNIILKGTLK